MILSIDPGKKHIGWALFAENRYLLSAGLAPCISPGWPNNLPSTGGVSHVVVELMTHYPTARARDAKANDLLDLQFTAGYLAGFYRVQFSSYRTAEWKGQLPKEVCKQRILKRLQGYGHQNLEVCLESVTPSLRHNVYDAVGIGLHYFGRGVLCGE